jgi:hypothetical protein
MDEVRDLMEINNRLQLLIDLDEFKGDSTATKYIVETAKILLGLEGEMKEQFNHQIEVVRHIFINDSLTAKPSLTVTLDKLYSFFHEFLVV